MYIAGIEKGEQLADYYQINDQLKNHIYGRAERAFSEGDRARDLISDTRQLHERQEFIKKSFLSSIGGLPEIDAPLNAVTTGRVPFDGFSVEKVVYQSRPGCYVTSNLYIPDNIIKPCGAVLYLCGHSRAAKNNPVYQEVCRHLVLAGLVVLIQDPVGQGERLSYYEKALGNTAVDGSTIEHDYDGCRCLLVGDSIARYMVHDAIRSIDYHCCRPEVDPERIGVSGDSGGGTKTSMVMMCEPRIAAAAPAVFIMNRRAFMYTGSSQDSEQNWPGFTARGIDHEDILISMAPKPVLVLSAEYDFFPIEGARETVKRCKRFWDMYGKGEDIGICESRSAHGYAEDLAKAAAGFFSKHLGGSRINAGTKENSNVFPMEMPCTKTGQVRMEHDNARSVFEENRDRLTEMEVSKRTDDIERRNKAYEWLKQKVFSYRKPCDINCRVYDEEMYFGLRVRKCLWWSQKDIMNHGLVFTECRFGNKNPPVTIALWRGGTKSLDRHIHWIRSTCSGGRAVMVLDVSGVGGSAPQPFDSFPVHEFSGVIFKLAYDMIWLDDSIAALRVYDVIRSLDMMLQCGFIGTDDTAVYSFDDYGIYGFLAAFLDRRIRRVDISGDIQAFSDVVNRKYYEPYDIMSVIIPGALKYFDIPDIRRWTEEAWQ